MYSAVSLLTEKLDQLWNTKPCKNTLIRLESPVSEIDILSYLARQNNAKKMRAYWSDRDGNFAVGGLASAWEYPLVTAADIAPAFIAARKLLSSLPEPTSARCFSYLSFSDAPAQIWPEFGYGKVWLPLIEMSHTPHGFLLACHLRVVSDDAWQPSISKIQVLLQPLLQQQPIVGSLFRMSQSYNKPDRQCWHELMHLAFEQFRLGSIEKVVLSRKTSYKLDGCICPWQLMQRWSQANDNAYSFLFEGKNDHFFLGCSPERLFRRYQNTVSTEALSGTSPRGKGAQDDEKIAAALMHDRKNIHENRLVLRDIVSRLQPLCQWLETDKSHSIVKLKNVQHLRYLISGQLRSEITDEALLLSLHPTPAVGGMPRTEACLLINEHEPYSRGLYAGVCGIVGVDITDLCVSIRSACIKVGSISLYAGAGIVEGSLPDNEWRELNNKIMTVQEILFSLQRSQSHKEVKDVSLSLP